MEDDIDLGAPIGQDARVTRRQLRATRKRMEANPAITPPPAEGLAVPAVFAAVGICLSLWAIGYMVARAREVLVAGGW